MKKRVITAATLLATLIPIFTIKVLLPVFLIVMTILVIIGSHEMLKMFNNKEEMPKPFMAMVMILTVLFYSAIVYSSSIANLDVFKEYFYFIDLPTIIFLIVLLLLTTVTFMPKYSMNLLNNSLVTILYIGLGFGSITILRLIGIRFVIYLFLITAITDMFAYFFGVKFGKNKLAPNISPKKSIEGAIAGSIAGTLFASLFALFFNIYGKSLNPDNLQTIFTGFLQMGDLSRWAQAVLIIPLTLFGTIVSQAGDLVASRFKRQYEIKDFGSLFPGHGGVVDRFDSAMFLSMFLVFLLNILAQVLPL